MLERLMRTWPDEPELRDEIKRLEQAVDSCDRVGHVLEGISVKHG